MCSSVKKTRICESLKEPAHVFYGSHLLPYVSVPLTNPTRAFSSALGLLLSLNILFSISIPPYLFPSPADARDSMPPRLAIRHSSSHPIILPVSLCGSSLRDNSSPSVTFSPFLFDTCPRNESFTSRVYPIFSLAND